MEITPKFVEKVLASATLLFTAQEISQAFDVMCQSITQRLEHQDVVALPVMNGGLMTSAEIFKRVNFPMTMSYIHASRYGGEVSGRTSIHWKREPDVSLEGKTVLVIDDILDGGLTLSAILDYCQAMGAKAVYTAVLLDKVNARAENAIAHADFTGLTCGNEYVFGFGLDYHEYLRNLPQIYRVAPEHML